jgi:hypothetical protein
MDIKRMSPGALLAAFLLVAAAIFVIYSVVITPYMDSGVSEQGYRRPIQDQASPKLKDEKEPPLQKSNVPPPGK